MDLTEREIEDGIDTMSSPPDSSSTLSGSSRSFRKLCVVCGGATRHLHYQKAVCVYFRRYIARDYNYKCSKFGNCDLQGRNKCKSCRISKLLSIGLTPEVVHENKALREKILFRNKGELPLNQTSQENGLIVGTEVVTYSSGECSTSNESFLTPNNYQPSLDYRMRFGEYIQNMLYTDHIYQKVRNGVWNNPNYIDMSIDDLFKKPSDFGQITRSSFEATTEIINKDNVYRHRMLDSILINLDYIKTFPFYSTLLLDDQKEILRFTGASLSIADNSYYSYVNGYSTITCPDGFQPIRMRHPEQPTKMDIIVSTNLVEMFQRLKPSPEEYCLLKILIFLNLNESKLSPETVLIINCERQKYSSTLLSYLQLQKGPTSGAVRFTEILNAVGTIFQYGDKLKDFQRIELIAARHRAEPAKCTPLPMLKYVMDL